MDDTPKLLADRAASVTTGFSDDKLLLHVQYLDDPTRFATVVLSPAAFVRLKAVFSCWLGKEGYFKEAIAVGLSEKP